MNRAMQDRKLKRIQSRGSLQKISRTYFWHSLSLLRHSPLSTFMENTLLYLSHSSYTEPCNLGCKMSAVSCVYKTFWSLWKNCNYSARQSLKVSLKVLKYDFSIKHWKSFWFFHQTLALYSDQIDFSAILELFHFFTNLFYCWNLLVKVILQYKTKTVIREVVNVLFASFSHACYKRN